MLNLTQTEAAAKKDEQKNETFDGKMPKNLQILYKFRCLTMTFYSIHIKNINTRFPPDFKSCNFAYYFFSAKMNGSFQTTEYFTYRLVSFIVKLQLSYM